ncbi:MAG: hypothetical protein JWN34_2000 [Bryobacterales bacterium]|nr:hypothetical protein [Bryobacterales bacterium]
MPRFLDCILYASLAVLVTVGIVAVLAVLVVLASHFFPVLNILPPADEKTQLKQSAERFAAEQSGWPL